MIETSCEYDFYSKLQEKEREILKGIATEYLETLDLKNERIKMNYIRDYVDKNSTIQRCSDYVRSMRYTKTKDMYVAFFDGIKNDTYKEEMKAHIEENEKTTLLNNAIDRIDELETEEKIEELKSNMDF